MECVTTMTSKIDKKQLMKLISFMTMADGGIYRRNRSGKLETPYFMMNMLTKNKDYIEFVQETLNHVTTTSLTDVENPCKNPQMCLRTKHHPYFEAIWERIYIEGYKGLDIHAFKLLDWESLAILYMCDGSLSTYQRDSKEYYHITVNMKRLSYGDQLFMKKAFKDTFDIEFNINQGKTNGKTYYYLRLRTKDVKTFMNGIRPHVLPSFHYKLLTYDVEQVAPETIILDDDIVCSA